FKLLATQCSVVGSPSRSPTTSPVVHLRRRKTLRMLLNRTDRRRLPRREGSPKQDLGRRSPPENPDSFRARHKLRDLFVSSPPPPPPPSERRGDVCDRLLAEAGTGMEGGGGASRLGASPAAQSGRCRRLSGTDCSGDLGDRYWSRSPS
ncbi:uncharacterized protein J3R85_008291, partial [Psidium guajava]